MSCFIFDVDGTLIDSAPVYLPALKQVLHDYGYTPTPEQVQTAFGMTGWEGLRLCGVHEDKFDEVMHSWEQEAYRHLEHVLIYDGIVDTLHALRQAGHKLGIVTSRNRSQYENGFVPLGLADLFDTAVCSDEVAAPKPAPDSIYTLLERVGGTAGDAVFLGDSPYDMQCARAAGVKAALALWGCHDQTLEADFRLTHPCQLLDLLH